MISNQAEEDVLTAISIDTVQEVLIIDTNDYKFAGQNVILNI